jgi:hypothetical protein
LRQNRLAAAPEPPFSLLRFRAALRLTPAATSTKTAAARKPVLRWRPSTPPLHATAPFFAPDPAQIHERAGESPNT